VISNVKTSLFAISLLAAALPVSSQPAPSGDSLWNRAWTVLRAGAVENSHEKRAQCIDALGLLPGIPTAREMAEAALKDPSPDVRTAAASALGDMKATQSNAALRAALNDPDPGVVLAAASSLLEMKDPVAYDVYFEILTGERKAKDGLTGEGSKTLHDPKKMTMLGVQGGLAFVPFGGLGFGAYRYFSKDNVSPVRAMAAASLAKDPDTAAGDALYKATADAKWQVQVAALRALAKRGEARYVNAAITAMSDDKAQVQYTAAAVAIRLSSPKVAAGRSKTPGGRSKAAR
jgi:HEAT repeat protein